MIKKEYIKEPKVNEVYRADALDLGLTNTDKPHDVIVTSINNRSKKCKVKTITSLEEKEKIEMVEVIIFLKLLN